ncbi:MAG: CHAT domain-containing protein [Candidatus Krumholzibacteriota bacterium]|nr:CHAT domain-containing protein [Candidatus Krumholzibacteriota bacterium]
MRRFMLIFFLINLTVMTGSDSADCFTADNPPRVSGDSISVLEERIVGFRKEANYGEALKLAKEILYMRQEDSQSRAFEIKDIEILVNTLEFIMGLSTKEKQELAEASLMAETMDSLYSANKYDEATAVVEKQLEIQRRILGEEHVEVAQSLDDLSGLITYVGDYERSAGLKREVLKIRRRILGNEHPEVAKTIVSVAGSLQASNDYAGADSLYTEALEMQKRIYGEEHMDIARTIYEIGGLLKKKKDYEGALSKYRTSLEMQRKIHGDDHLEIASNLHAIAGILNYQGDYAGAEPLYREALAMKRKFLGDEHPFVAALLNDLGGLFWHKGDYTTTESFLREALAIRKKLMGKDHIAIAYSLNNIGHVVMVQGNYAEARLLTQEALEILRKNYGDEHEDIAWTLSTLATITRLQGDYEDAVPIFREALAMQKNISGEENYAYAVTLSNFAGLLNSKGDYLDAEPLFRKCLAIDQKLLGKNHKDVATDLNNLAALLENKGDYSAAVSMYLEALAIYRETVGDTHPEVANCLGNMAQLHKSQGYYTTAEQLFREALSIYRSTYENGHPNIAISLSNLAGILMLQKDYMAADSLYGEAISHWKKIAREDHPDYAQILKSYSKLLYKQGNKREAESLVMRVTSIREKLMGRTHPDLVSDFNDIALLRWEEEDYQNAEKYFSKSAEIFEVARLRAGTGFNRATFQRSPYPGLAAIQLMSGKENKAWPKVEMHQGRILSELLLSSDQRELKNAEIVQEDSLQNALAAIEGELKTFRKMASADTTGEMQKRVDETHDKLLATELEYSVLQQEMAKLYPVTEGRSFSLERIQKTISNGTALIGWLDVAVEDGKYACWGYVIRHKGPVKWAGIECASKNDGSESPYEYFKEFRRSLSSPESSTDFRIKTREIWAQRIAPLGEWLKDIDCLIVIPSGLMLGVPVEALEDEKGTLLGDRYVISYIPSATIYSWLAERSGKSRKRESRHVLLVGDPPFSEAHAAAMQMETGLAGNFNSIKEPAPEIAVLRGAVAGNGEALAALPRLPGSRQEVIDIATIAPEATVLIGPDATEQELAQLADLDSLKEFSTIHIATHALVDDEYLERSALVLSQVNLPDPLEAALTGSRIYDGLVTAKEIIQDWKLKADLVTLSACETGLGKRVGGEGYIGLSHAFFRAGARSLIVSLWKVDDRATALLMRRFYGNLWEGNLKKHHGHGKKSMSKAEALQEAKEWLRNYNDQVQNRPFDHPYFWSAFVLIGESN